VVLGGGYVNIVILCFAVACGATCKQKGLYFFVFLNTEALGKPGNKITIIFPSLAATAKDFNCILPFY
jgi:hypothetical protein